MTDRLSMQAKDANGFVIPGVFRLGASQDVAIGAAHLESTAVANGTTLVRLVGTVACRVKIGTAPVATGTDCLLPAGVPLYAVVAPGVDIVSCIQEGAVTGKLNITEMAGSI